MCNTTSSSVKRNAVNTQHREKPHKQARDSMKEFVHHSFQNFPHEPVSIRIPCFPSHSQAITTLLGVSFEFYCIFHYHFPPPSSLLHQWASSLNLHRHMLWFSSSCLICKLSFQYFTGNSFVVGLGWLLCSSSVDFPGCLLTVQVSMFLCFP